MDFFNNEHKGLPIDSTFIASSSSPNARGQTSLAIIPVKTLHVAAKNTKQGVRCGYCKGEILAGKVKVEGKFLADGGWAYACHAPSEDYIRTLKQGDRVSIRPDNQFVHLNTQGKHLRLKIIDVMCWGNL